jgi:hypothetical protein
VTIPYLQKKVLLVSWNWCIEHRPSNLFIYIFIITFFFVVLGLELRAYTLSHSTSPFLWWAFIKIRSLQLFAWIGFEPQSSWSLSPE